MGDPPDDAGSIDYVVDASRIHAQHPRPMRDALATATTGQTSPYAEFLPIMPI